MASTQCCSGCKQVHSCEPSLFNLRPVCANCAKQQLTDFRAACAKRAETYVPPVVTKTGGQ